ncbi:MAG: hypothetical protein ACYC99_14950 [Candidatus Geothermincolia bacterium]
MEGSVLIILIVSAVLGFFIMAAAVAVGTIAAHGHIEKRAAKLARPIDPMSNRPSQVRARREAEQQQTAQAPPAQPGQWR